MMEDFVRIMPKQGYEKWPSLLGRMSQLYFQTEYQTVKENLRPAALINIDPENFQERIDKINGDDLMFTPLGKIGLSQSYSLLIKSVKAGEPFLWRGVLTKTYQDAKFFKKAYFKNDHKTIGKFLGFPECCMEYFSREFSVNADPVWVNLKGRVNGFPECNTLLRYFGVRATSHMPCSPKCLSTQKIGRVWLGMMQTINHALSKEFHDLLAGPVVWNSYHGVVQVETPYFVGLSKTFPYLRKPRIINWNSEPLKDSK